MTRVLVVTGAGISAESGIPTFRGKEGYWRNLDPMKLATQAAFQQDPELVWQWYRERRALVRRSEPNPAHEAVVQLAFRVPDLLVLTQNVDDLHARAAWRGRHLRADQLLQVHGDLFVDRCVRCGHERRDDGAAGAGVPSCPLCGAPMRPGVVWFDEELDPTVVAHVERFLARGACDVVLVVGTTASFDYIVGWALRAKAASGDLIEINPAATPLSPFATQLLREPAAVALPRLVETITAAR